MIWSQSISFLRPSLYDVLLSLDKSLVSLQIIQRIMGKYSSSSCFIIRGFCFGGLKDKQTHNKLDDSGCCLWFIGIEGTALKFWTNLSACMRKIFCSRICHNVVNNGVDCCVTSLCNSTHHNCYANKISNLELSYTCSPTMVNMFYGASHWCFAQYTCEEWK